MSVVDDTVLFVGNFVAVFAFLLQIFIVCVFGQTVISAYDPLCQQLFHCDWPKMIAASNQNNPKNMRSILIFLMEELKRERKIMIGKVFPLSLSTFSSVNSL